MLNESNWIFNPITPIQVKECREQRSLTQVQMAEVFGVIETMWQFKEATTATNSPVSVAESNLLMLLAGLHPGFILTPKADLDELPRLGLVTEPVNPLVVKSIRAQLGQSTAEMAKMFNISEGNYRKRERATATGVKCTFAESNLLLLIADQHPNYKIIPK